jgi:ketosteroid isomerase-like protein
MRYLSLLVSAFTVLVLTGAVPGQSNEKTAEREVRALERAWLDAYEKHDVKAMTEIVGDEFVIIFPNGQKQTKQQVIDMIKRPGRPGMAVKHRTEDVKAEVRGDKVVLRGRVISETLRDGAVISREESLYVDTYVRRDGRWQVVDSKLTEPPKKAS